ncbi:YegS/Rv2252/BmrU family lipid kinase [Neobacillus terrae]|uniref:YegS/Rv2252/BmrU family lipid kinase n=1 Tax=Neobacillus terrae TaxID=3034837 RepID=UPI00140A4B15|nr:YegS/Rv2252/BmrU family lipid kinase [Neobacillus terrae]
MQRFKKALLIYNGNAGQKDIDKSLGVSVPILTETIGQLLLLKTEEPGDAMKLCQAYGETVDLAIILGGDGTLHECVNGLAALKNRPVIAILPGGTCNDFSRSLGVPQDIKSAAEMLVNGEIVSVDAMKVNDGYTLNFCGLGLITETSNNIKENEKAALGRIGYYLSAIRTIRNMDPFSYRIEYDGEISDGEAVMILAANGDSIGTRTLPCKDISYNDGLADIFIIKNAGLGVLKEYLSGDFSLADEEEELSKEILHFSGKKINIRTDQPRDVDTDGEVYLKTPLEIEVLQHHFQMLKPKAEN